MPLPATSNLPGAGDTLALGAAGDDFTGGLRTAPVLPVGAWVGLLGDGGDGCGFGTADTVAAEAAAAPDMPAGYVTGCCGCGSDGRCCGCEGCCCDCDQAGCEFVTC